MQKMTIIVPVYNVEKYLQRCITSLTEQTLKEIEIILVDDGSTDKSGLICDLFAEKDERIKVIHKQNEGQGIARNAGIDASTGEYICFLDSDDYLEKNACAKLYAYIKFSESDICTYGYCIESPEGETVRIPKIRERVYFENEIISEFILHFFGDDPKEDDLRGFSSCMSVFRSSIIRDNNVRFPSEREVFSEDT
ncbi:MAG: glycosyltransferase, partial [Lachnospiraceae bacterium]|nr:glycosyltransferase [Lachnospiraceae bacterium]